MESVSIFEGLSTDWLMLAGLVFLLPKILFASLAVLVINAEKVPFLNRLLGDRVKTLKSKLSLNPMAFFRPGNAASKADDDSLRPTPKDR